jgi:hypothetical protein
MRSEKQTGKQVKALRSDNGTEFVNGAFERFLKKHGIRHERTQVYSPEQNGLSERLNRTLTEKARCLLRQASLPLTFWGEAIRMANFLRNHSPAECLEGKVPAEIWKDQVPTVKYFRKFGCTAFAHIPKVERKGKFGRRARKGIFIGYCENKKGFRLWDPEAKRVITSRDVRFNERDTGWYKGETDGQTEGSCEDDETIFITFDDRDQVNSNRKQMNSESVAESVIVSEEVTLEDPEIEEDIQAEMNSGSLEPEEEEDDVVIVDEVREEPTQRILRERTPKVKPVKYTVVVETKETVESSSQGPSKSWAKKQRRLKRVQERKKVEGPIREQSESRKILGIDIFSKYGPDFED